MSLRFKTNDGKTLAIWFEYDTEGKLGRKNIDPNKSVVTECFIKEHIGPKQYKDLGTGTAVKSSEDIFSKSIGRKVALGRALINAKIDRKTRSEIWKSYFESGQFAF